MVPIAANVGAEYIPMAEATAAAKCTAGQIVWITTEVSA